MAKMKGHAKPFKESGARNDGTPIKKKMDDKASKSRMPVKKKIP